MRFTRRSTTALFTLAALAAAAGTASAYDPDDESMECAEYISSGAGDTPLQGHLIGTEDVTLTIKGGGSVSAGGKVVGGSAGGEVSRTIEYQVGYYDVGGAVYVIDCRSYTLIDVIHN